jgi:hypothetical protein
MIGTSSGKTIMATNKVLGRSTAGTGAIEEITLGSNLTLSGGTLTAGGGVSGVAASASDVLSVSGSDIAADDPGADRIIFWDESENKLTHLEVGSGLTLSGATLTGGGVSGTGSVDNAILRADGTGGSTLQNSGLIVEDTIVSFTTVTGTASDDIITATGSTFSNGQPVRFTALTGGTGLNTTTNYFVRAASGATFKLATTDSDATIVNFSTNITAGTLLTGHSVQANVTVSQNTTETNSALVLSPKGTGALIAGPKPDGTGVGGNARGARAVDLQIATFSATRVASGNDSVISGGEANTASGVGSVVSGGSSNTASGGYAVVCGGASNTASGIRSSVAGGEGNTASGAYSFAAGGLGSSVASGASSVALGGTANTTNAFANGGLANRHSMQSHAGGNFAANGDAQRARFVLRNKTTTNAAVELFLDGSATRLTIPSGKIFAFTINISGVKSDGSAVAHYLRQYALKNVAGTTTEVYAPVTIGTDNAAGTTIALSASDPNDALVVSVTGITSEIWRWVASVDAVEIAYGI